MMRQLMATGPRDEPGGHPTILIVDDDATVTATFGRMLTLEGFHVTVASTVASALEHAESGSPSAILSDLRMPFGDGLAFLRALRAMPAHRTTPVTIITGDYLLPEADVAELHRLQAQLRFKPLWLEDLVDLAKHMVQGQPAPR